MAISYWLIVDMIMMFTQNSQPLKANSVFLKFRFIFVYHIPSFNSNPMNTPFFRNAFAIAMLSFLFACSSDPVKDDPKKNVNDSGIVMMDTADRILAVHTDSTPPVWTGDYVKKYKNGVIMMKGEYKYGKRWGQWMSFYETGKLWSEGLYKDGKRDGYSTVYFENGNKHMTGNYKEGRMVGKWTVFSEDGKSHKTVDYGQ